MNRRDFLHVVTAVSVVDATAAAAGQSAGPVMAGNGERWVGGSALKGGKGYAAAPLGQIHYRTIGDGAATPILLIHQTPIGMAEFIDIQPALARLGRRSIVSDNPGYGLSDPPPGPISVPDLADNLIGLLDHLAAPKVIVVGHHTGAAIGAAFAARHPQRTAGVVLQGCPLYTAEERAERLARPQADVTLKRDGSHLSQMFHGMSGYLGPDSDNLAAITWATLGIFMAATPSETYKAVFSNDMAEDLRAIRAPTLILTDSGDTLHQSDLKAAAMRPDFSLKVFSSGKSFALMGEPQRWAETLAAFADVHHL
jgi:pimeloyl-ACP methyl ester carboxylesterase